MFNFSEKWKWCVDFVVVVGNIFEWLNVNCFVMYVMFFGVCGVEVCDF